MTPSHELRCDKREGRRNHNHLDDGEVLNRLEKIISTFYEEQRKLLFDRQAQDDSLLKSYESLVSHIETDFSQRIDSCKAQQQLLMSALNTSQASLENLQREIANIEESIAMRIEAEAELEQARNDKVAMEREKYERIKQEVLQERSQKDLILSKSLIEACGYHLRPGCTEQGYRKKRCTDGVGMPKSPDSITNDDGSLSDSDYISLGDV